MRVLLDLNIVLDVLASRHPFYEDSAAVVDGVVRRDIAGVLPVHGITTIYYILAKRLGRSGALEAVTWLLSRFEVPSCGMDELAHATTLDFRDYEDAVAAVVAERSGCSSIVTRDTADYHHSPVAAITPAELLGRLGWQ